MLKRAFYFSSWLMGSLLLAACGPAAAPKPAANGTLEATAVVPTAQPASTTATENSQATAQTAIIASDGREVTLFTNDNRSNQLQRLTSSWNTNWNKHTIDYGEILSGGPPRDGIPSVDQPQFVTPAEADSWLSDNEPVIALNLEGDARAYPLQILTWHEIVNDTVGSIPVTVTFCPLCNSAITFDRRHQGQVYEFGTSGLLRNSDLIMYDRTTESLWQQFTGEAIVGELAGERLTFLPSAIISFAEFRQAFPLGQILGRETGFNRRYGENPYVGYDDVGNAPFLFTGVIDGRLAAMERVVTVSLQEPGVDIAYPLSLLSPVSVINDRVNGRLLAVFHTSGTASALGSQSIANAADVGATGVFDATLDGQTLTFNKIDKAIIDNETGSSWNILGQAIAGPLVGKQLTPIVHGDHFWFSWAAFKPDTIIYQP